MCNFYVGQKVVCVDAKPAAHLDGLAEGKIYIIRRVGVATSWDTDEGAAVVWLEGLARTRYCGPTEPGYLATRFRPLTDISSLEALLTQAPKTKTRESEDA